MPLNKPEDCPNGDMNAESCVHCTDSNGEIKSCDEIFEGGVHFFMGATGSSREDAEKLVRKNMKALPYWEDKGTECLEGEIATDEEFKAALGKM